MDQKTKRALVIMAAVIIAATVFGMIVLPAAAYYCLCVWHVCENHCTRTCTYRVLGICLSWGPWTCRYQCYCKQYAC